MKQEKYFVGPGLGDWHVIYQDWDDIAGNHWASKASGFDNEATAQTYADELNRNIASSEGMVEFSEYDERLKENFTPQPNVVEAHKFVCKSATHKIVHVGSFMKHEGCDVDTYYCAVCNTTWNEL